MKTPQMPPASNSPHGANIPQTIQQSTFQKRPAYKYLRLADKLPSIDEAREEETPIARVKLFNPSGSWTWYVAGYDPETHMAWGLVDGHEPEFGMFSMTELCAIRGQFGLPIERDLSWTPRAIAL